MKTAVRGYNHGLLEEQPSITMVGSSVGVEMRVDEKNVKTAVATTTTIAEMRMIRKVQLPMQY